jgi:hypothetical protein
MEQPVMQMITTRLHEIGADLVPVPGLQHPLSHGEAMRRLVEYCEDDHVLLIDEDCLFLRPGEVERAFALIEGGECDIVAPAVDDATPEIVAHSKRAFGLDAPPHFAPCPFYAAREVLVGTDLEFGERSWQQGDVIPLLDLVCQQQEFMPTFIWTSIQMRARGARARHLVRHDGPDDPASDFFLESPPWVHIGALAQGRDVLVDEEGIMIGFRELGWRGTLDTMSEMAPAYWEKKLAVWMLCRQWFPIGDPRAAYYNDVFDSAAANVLTRKQGFLSHRRLGALISAYSVLLAPLLTHASVPGLE